MADTTYCPHNPNEHLECSLDACPCCGGLGVAARCPHCHGAGAICTRTLREAQQAHVPQFEKCTVCRGAGWFPITEELFNRLGFAFRPGDEHLYTRKAPQRAIPV